MLDVLPLPIAWLGAFCIGRALDGKSLDTRRTVVASCSIAALILGCGLVSGGVYVGISVGVILAGNLIRSLEGRSRQFAFIVFVAGVTLMIVGFLKFRFYISKYFLYLPSLSYLGFRAIAYLTSVYRREQVSLSTAGLQLMFFPMLFTGPISRVENFQTERRDYEQVLRRLVYGLAMLTGGYLLKEFILPEFILHRASAQYIPCWMYWRSVFAITFELYFTFAGYSHLIIGLGLLVGFQLPENFNNPYMAASIGEFWRKWHMSLSYWIRDYLYIPLGGNRKGLLRKCFNLLLAMSICGVWHGLSMNFFLWGLFHGSLLSIESICAHYHFEPMRKLPTALQRPLRVVRTFGLVTFGWLLFMYSMPAFWVHLKGLIP